MKLIESMNRGKKTFKELDDKIKNLNKSYEQNALRAEDLEEALGDLRRQIDSTVDQDKKAELIKSKAALEQANAANKAAEIFGDSAAKLSGAVVGGVLKAFANTAKAAAVFKSSCKASSKAGSMRPDVNETL